MQRKAIAFSLMLLLAGCASTSKPVITTTTGEPPTTIDSGPVYIPEPSTTTSTVLITQATDHDHEPCGQPGQEPCE